MITIGRLFSRKRNQIYRYENNIEPMKNHYEQRVVMFLLLHDLPVAIVDRRTAARIA